jgi:hypothetical protein
MEKEKVYYKITNEEEKHFGYQYKTGLNVLDKPFNSDPNSICCAGGLYFAKLRNILRFVNHGTNLRVITLPTEDPNFQMVRETNGQKLRANMIILGEKRELNIDTIQKLIDDGADVNVGNSFALRYYAENGKLDIVRLLVERGANVFADDNYALIYSAKNGHTGIARFLLENGADATSNDSLALRQNAQLDRLEIVELLVKHGANVNAGNGFALKWCTDHDYWKLARFLLENGAKSSDETIDLENVNSKITEYNDEKATATTAKHHTPKFITTRVTDPVLIEPNRSDKQSSQDIKSTKPEHTCMYLAPIAFIKTAGRYATLGELDIHTHTYNYKQKEIIPILQTELLSQHEILLEPSCKHEGLLLQLQNDEILSGHIPMKELVSACNAELNSTKGI